MNYLWIDTNTPISSKYWGPGTTSYNFCIIFLLIVVLSRPTRQSSYWILCMDVGKSYDSQILTWMLIFFFKGSGLNNAGSTWTVPSCCQKCKISFFFVVFFFFKILIFLDWKKNKHTFVYKINLFFIFFFF